MTEKLYELNAYIKEFNAKVLECISFESFYKIVLDKTAFSPKGEDSRAIAAVLAAQPSAPPSCTGAKFAT